jgi:hypothetical protein
MNQKSSTKTKIRRKKNLWHRDPGAALRYSTISEENNRTAPKQDAKEIFLINSNKIYIITEVTVHPLSFDWKLKIEFLAHFYTRNTKMKLRRGKESYPSRVLYIGSSKRLNDYYALSV